MLVLLSSLSKVPLCNPINLILFNNNIGEPEEPLDVPTECKKY